VFRRFFWGKGERGDEVSFASVKRAISTGFSILGKPEKLAA